MGGYDWMYISASISNQGPKSRSHSPWLAKSRVGQRRVEKTWGFQIRLRRKKARLPAEAISALNEVNKEMGKAATAVENFELQHDGLGS